MAESITSVGNEQLASMSGWQVAEALGCRYSGDSDPVRHEGFFYDPRDWAEHGYARAVEFWEDPETGALVVQPGTIHRPDDMTAAFRCCDIPADEQGNIDAQIEAARGYCGIEPDGTRYPDLKTFDLDAWRERNIWKSVRGWVEELGR